MFSFSLNDCNLYCFFSILIHIVHILIMIYNRSVTNTTEDIAHVTSILVTMVTSHDGQVDVAHGSTFDAPSALSDLGNLEVKGDVTGTTSEG